MTSQRTPLTTYLLKLSQGDMSCADAVCRQLTDRLVYIPTTVGGRSTEGQRVKVTVIKLPDGTVPLFTTERYLRDWAGTLSEPTEMISLMAGDFCLTLTNDQAVLIDPGTEHSVSLTSDLVKKVALPGEPSPLLDPIITPPPTEPEIKAASPTPEKVQIPIVTQRPEGVRGRSERTSIMPRPTRPAVRLDEDSIQRKMVMSGAPALPAPTSNTLNPAPVESLLKKMNDSPKANGSGKNGDANHNKKTPPVILSPDADSNKVVREKEDFTKPKKRSLLGYLKGQE